MKKFIVHDDFVEVKPLSEYDVVDLIVTMRDCGMSPSILHLSEDDIAKGVVIQGFTMAQLMVAYMNYNKTKKVEAKFIDRILSSSDNIVIQVGKVTSYKDDVATDHGMADGFFLHADSQEEKLRASVSAVVGAVLTTNPVTTMKKDKKVGKIVEKQFVKADGTGEVYCPVDVFTTAGQYAEHYVSDDVMNLMGRQMRASITQKIMSEPESAPFYRDILARNLTPINSNKASAKMTAVYDRVPLDQNPGVAKYHAQLEQKYLGGNRVRSNPPVKKAISPNGDPLKQMWMTYEKYRAVRGDESGFISNFTNGYYLGELGADFDLVIPLCMDILDFMNEGKYAVVAKVNVKKHNRVWEILACNTLVHDDTAIEYDVKGPNGDGIGLKKVGIFNFDRVKDMSMMKWNVGGMLTQPSVTKVVKYANLDSGVSDIRKLLVSSNYTHVLTYSFPEIWKVAQFRVDPCRLAHSGYVWVSIGEQNEKYDVAVHCTRTIHAIQWKTYYPFHRRIYANADVVPNIPVRLLRRGKLLPVPFDDMIESCFLDDDEQRIVVEEYCEDLPVIRKTAVQDKDLISKVSDEERVRALLVRMALKEAEKVENEPIVETIIPPHDAEVGEDDL